MTTKQRRETKLRLIREGLPSPIVNRILRLATTLHRLSEAQCNGDYPADNGERRVFACVRCNTCWAPESMKRRPLRAESDGLITSGPVCPDCIATERVQELLKPFHGFEPIFNGDPRRPVLKLRVPSGATDDYENEGIVCG